MARVKASAVPNVSLFPFMSILVCLSGALVVMICVLTIAQASAAATSGSKKNPLGEEMMKIKAQLSEFRALTDQLSSLEEMEKRLLRLQEITEGDETSDQIRTRLQAEVESLKITIATLQEEKPRLQKLIAKLKDDLAERQIKPETLKPPLRVQGGGTGFAVGRRLYVVEANSDSIVVHLNKDDRMRIAAGAIGADKEYNSFLAQVAQNKNHLVLFLVRTDGWSTYERGAGWAENQFKLALSKMPIPGQGRVDLSEFERFMK